MAYGPTLLTLLPVLETIVGYAILTRYAGPTNYRGSRIIATGPAAHLPAWDAAPDTRAPMTRATVAWDYSLDPAGNHRAAAQAVCDKLRADGWHVMVGDGASLPDESGRVYLLDYSADMDAAPDPVAVLTDILTGPTSAGNAARLADGAARHLAESDYRIVRAAR